MGEYNKHTRIKDFKGLPHELKGIDYTDDAEVEGGEKAYKPLGSDNEFIFRNISKHLKDLEKLDKKYKNRPVGDRISDQSFDAAAKEIIIAESKDLMNEGIDPFNTQQEQNAFKVGGTKYATGGSRLDFNFTPTSDPSLANPQRYTTPTMDDNAVQSNQMGYNQIGNYAQTAGNLTTDISRISTDDNLNTDTKVNNAVKSTAKTALATTTPWGGPVMALEDTALGFLNTEQAEINGLQKEVPKDNASAGFQAAFEQAPMQAIDSFTEASNLQGKDKTAKIFEGIGDVTGSTTIPKMIQGFTGNNPDQKELKNREQQAGYDQVLAARDRFQGEGDIPRTRYNDQTIMRNGGVKKKYDGKNGSVLFDPNDPFAGLPVNNAGPLNWKNDISDTKLSYLDENVDPENPYNPMYNIGDGYGVSEAQTDQAFNDYRQEQFYKTPSGNYNNPDVRPPVKSPKKKMTPEQIQQLYQGILGFGTNAAGSIAYLAGEGKNYDKVNYPTFNPKHITANRQLSEARDQSASTIEALRQQGKLDPNALAQLATSGSKSVASIRENVANQNAMFDNQAGQFNIGTNIRAQQDEAANKGQALTNYYAALENLGKTSAGTMNQSSAISNDEMIRKMYENIFGKQV